jgi:hypothetical protein
VIHDNFHVVHYTAKLLHVHPRACILLKVDITKACDMVNWPFLLEMLRFIGFSRHWVNWISALLSRTSTRILLNGQPG